MGAAADVMPALSNSEWSEGRRRGCPASNTPIPPLAMQGLIAENAENGRRVRREALTRTYAPCRSPWLGGCETTRKRAATEDGLLI